MDDFVRVGGLAAISAALPRALRSWGEVRIILPGYRPAIGMLSNNSCISKWSANARRWRICRPVRSG
jgi:starch synthase